MRLTAYRTSETDRNMPLMKAVGDRLWMEHTPSHFADRCLPLRMANQAGWWLLCPGTFQATWNGSDDKSGITITEMSGGNSLSLVSSHFGSGILTFNIPYLFRTEPGYNLLVRGVPNEPYPHGIVPLEGLVETDWVNSTFTMNYKFTAPDITVTFGLGQPICQIVPQKRFELEDFEPEVLPLESDPRTRESFLAWSESRRTFNDDLQVTGSTAQKQKWQKDYVHAGIQKKMRLKGFDVL